MKMGSNDLRFAVNPKVASSVHDNGIVLLHLANGHLFASNAAGARIWRGVEERQPLEVIVNDINDAYQIGQTTAWVHVEAFLAELEQKELIKRETKS